MVRSRSWPADSIVTDERTPGSDRLLSENSHRSRAMIEGLIAGETYPAKLARPANRLVKASHEELCEVVG